MAGSFEEGLFAWLDQRPEFQALTFSNGAFFDGTHCNIWPGTIAEKAPLPAMGFARVGGPSPGLNMSGADGVNRARIQFTAIGAIYADPATLIGVLCGVPGTKSLLHGFKGEFPNGVVIQLARQMMEPIDSYVAEIRTYLRHVDFEFVYEI
jgi:hypothetical protein